MLTCALHFDSDDLVSIQSPAKFWTLFSICVIAALLLLCSLVLQLHTLVRLLKILMLKMSYHFLRGMSEDAFTEFSQIQLLKVAG